MVTKRAVESFWNCDRLLHNDLLSTFPFTHRESGERTECVEADDTKYGPFGQWEKKASEETINNGKL